MDEFNDFDAAGAFIEMLNGGAPLTDWQEISEWAQNLLRVRIAEVE